MSSPEVIDNPDRSQFEILVDDKQAGLAAYRLRPGVITFLHTEIDDAYEGQGLGGQLVRAALDSARERGLRVIPTCPFVKSWIERHPEYADVVRHN